MKCPSCQGETLTQAFWVPSGDGAYRMFECGTCGTLCRGGGTSRSGEFAIVTGVAASSDDVFRIKRARLRTG